MNLIKHSFLVFCLTLNLALLCSAQDTSSARVVGVVDGDTITVLTKDKRQLMLRLAEIDAPEKEQDFGVNAHQFLSGLILDQIVTVSGIKKDCLDRLTASVAFNKKDLSLLAVKSGNAWVDSTCQTNEMLVKEELSAREKKHGLWENPNPVHPAEFLKSGRQQQQKPPAAQADNSSGRRIFTGLAPAPPPPKNSLLFIGMTLEHFIEVCGAPPEKSSMATTSTRQSFSLNIPPTPENIKKKCNGSFSFDRESSDAPFRMWMANQ